MVLLAASLGLIVTWVSLNLRLPTRADTLHNLSAQLHGSPLIYAGEEFTKFPVYNRILFPALHEAITKHAGFSSAEQWYLLMRCASFQLAFLAFVFVCRNALGMPSRAIALPACLLAIATIVSFNFRWEDVTDAIDLLALSLSAGAALARRYLVCLLLAVFFALNREVAAYAGIVWFVLNATRTSFIFVGMQSAIISVASYGVAIAVRHAVRPASSANWITPLDNVEKFISALTTFHFPNWLAMLAATIALLFINVSFRGTLAKKFVTIALIFFAPAVVFGLLDELRVLLPNFLMLAFAVAASRAKERGGRPATAAHPG